MGKGTNWVSSRVNDTSRKPIPEKNRVPATDIILAKDHIPMVPLVNTEQLYFFACVISNRFLKFKIGL